MYCNGLQSACEHFPDRLRWGPFRLRHRQIEKSNGGLGNGDVSLATGLGAFEMDSTISVGTSAENEALLDALEAELGPL